MGNILTPDICVIGAGSGGLSVAAAASQLGANVVLVEKGKMGGDCLNTGCVPSKALLAAAKRAHLMKGSEDFGVKPQKSEVDFKAVLAHVDHAIKTIEPHDSVERFEGLGVHVIQEKGTFISDDCLKAGDHQIKARKFVIATGSTAFVPPIEGLGDVPYLTNENLFEPRDFPGHLLIIGGGPIGLEMAQAHHRLGAKVTVLEGATALGKDDPELTKIILDKLRAEGLDIFEETLVRSVEGTKGAIKISAEQNGRFVTFEGSHLLVATGRKPTIDGLGLEAAGVDYSRRGIKVDQGLRTTNKKIFAIGDVAGSLQFTHMANYQAGLVIRRLLFKMPVKQKTTHIPWVTYTDPELAHIGLTEAAAKEQYGDQVTVVRFPYKDNDRAVATRKTDGLVKVVIGKRGKILGASIAGEAAGELIQMWSLAISNGLKIKAMTNYVSPYPTLSELNKRVAYKYYEPKLKSKLLHKVVGFLQKF